MIQQEGIACALTGDVVAAVIQRGFNPRGSVTYRCEAIEVRGGG